MQLVYSTAPADWATDRCVGIKYLHLTCRLKIVISMFCMQECYKCGTWNTIAVSLKTGSADFSASCTSRYHLHHQIMWTVWTSLTFFPPTITVIHHSWQVIQTISSFYTELLSLLVGQHLYAHAKESIGEHHLWVHPCFFGCAPHVLFALVGWSVRWMVSGHTTVDLCIVASRIVYLESIDKRSVNCSFFNLVQKNGLVWFLCFNGISTFVGY